MPSAVAAGAQANNGTWVPGVACGYRSTTLFSSICM